MIAVPVLPLVKSMLMIMLEFVYYLMIVVRGCPLKIQPFLGAKDPPVFDGVRGMFHTRNGNYVSIYNSNT